MTRPHPALPTLLTTIAALAGCTGDLAPRGEVVLVVDTDLPAPRFAGRLRVDVFREDGAWIATRDVPRPSALGWPASFSVVAGDDDPGAVALVRLRAYAEGAVRDARGERYVARTPAAAPTVAKTLAEACGAPTRIGLGVPAVVRRGRAAILGPDGACGAASASSGAAAITLDVPAAGAYRCAVLGTTPSRADLHATFEAVALAARARCDDPATALACDAATGAPTASRLPRVDLALDPGPVTLLVSAPAAGARPADVVVGCALASAWPAAWDAPPVAPPRAAPPCADPADAPVLAQDPGRTPSTEPEPRSAVDRLVAVRVPADARRAARVVLRGACLGTMARLADACPRAGPVLAEAATCVDEPGVIAPVREAALDDDPIAPAVGEVGTFPPADACAAAADGELVCVPGGLFLFGDRDADGFAPFRTAPEHAARMSRFAIDRHEVTVARWRAALGAGFDPGAHAPYANEHPIGASSVDERRLCSWSAAPRGREDLALSCVDFEGASAFCAFVGGSLPTEAEWEWVASAAGRDHETTYPWGEGAPACQRAAVARWDDPSTGSTVCRYPEFGPAPVGAFPDDATPLGVVGLGGGLSEWTRDAFRDYDDPCWEGAPLLDPACLEDEPPMRVARGAHFRAAPGTAFAANRLRIPSDAKAPYLGFRCVYRGAGVP